MTTNTDKITWDEANHYNDADFSIVWCHAENADVTPLVEGPISDAIDWTTCPSCAENALQYRPQ